MSFLGCIWGGATFSLTKMGGGMVAVSHKWKGYRGSMGGGGILRPRAVIWHRPPLRMFLVPSLRHATKQHRKPATRGMVSQHLRKSERMDDGYFTQRYVRGGGAGFSTVGEGGMLLYDDDIVSL